MKTQILKTTGTKIFTSEDGMFQSVNPKWVEVWEKEKLNRWELSPSQEHSWHCRGHLREPVKNETELARDLTARLGVEVSVARLDRLGSPQGVAWISTELPTVIRDQHTPALCKALDGWILVDRVVRFFFK